MSKWREILMDYVDDDGVRHLDGYQTGDPNEVGFVIGFVLPSGSVLWRDPEHQFDPEVKVALAEARQLQLEDRLKETSWDELFEHQAGFVGANYQLLCAWLRANCEPPKVKESYHAEVDERAEYMKDR